MLLYEMNAKKQQFSDPNHKLISFSFFIVLQISFYSSQVFEISCKLTGGSTKGTTSLMELISFYSSTWCLPKQQTSEGTPTGREAQCLDARETGAGCSLLKVRGSPGARGRRSAITHNLGQSPITQTTTHRHAHIHTPQRIKLQPCALCGATSSHRLMSECQRNNLRVQRKLCSCASGIKERGQRRKSQD